MGADRDRGREAEGAAGQCLNQQNLKFGAKVEISTRRYRTATAAAATTTAAAAAAAAIS